jgi:hypothetical protein
MSPLLKKEGGWDTSMEVSLRIKEGEGEVPRRNPSVELPVSDPEERGGGEPLPLLQEEHGAQEPSRGGTGRAPQRRADREEGGGEAWKRMK